MDAGREFPVFQGQQHFYDTGDTGGRFQMTDIGLHRSDAADGFRRQNPSVFFTEHFKGFLQPVDFNGIPQSGTGAVGFDVGDAVRCHVGVLVGIHQ